VKEETQEEERQKENQITDATSPISALAPPKTPATVDIYKGSRLAQPYNSKSMEKIPTTPDSGGGYRGNVRRRRSDVGWLLRGALKNSGIDDGGNGNQGEDYADCPIGSEEKAFMSELVPTGGLEGEDFSLESRIEFATREKGAINLLKNEMGDGIEHDIRTMKIDESRRRRFSAGPSLIKGTAGAGRGKGSKSSSGGEDGNKGNLKASEEGENEDGPPECESPPNDSEGEADSLQGSFHSSIFTNTNPTTTPNKNNSGARTPNQNMIGISASTADLAMEGLDPDFLDKNPTFSKRSEPRRQTIGYHFFMKGGKKVGDGNQGAGEGNNDAGNAGENDEEANETEEHDNATDILSASVRETPNYIHVPSGDKLSATSEALFTPSSQRSFNHIHHSDAQASATKSSLERASEAMRNLRAGIDAATRRVGSGSRAGSGNILLHAGYSREVGEQGDEGLGSGKNCD